MATAKENEKIARRFTEEIWEKQNFDSIDEFVAEDFVLHDSSMPEPLRGRDEYREMAEEGASIIDGPIETDQLIVTGDWVVARWTRRGTHTGNVMGIEPTNEEVTVTGIEINRFEDGKLVEAWHEVNIFGMLMQIGALPEDLSFAE